MSSTVCPSRSSSCLTRSLRAKPAWSLPIATFMTPALPCARSLGARRCPHGLAGDAAALRHRREPAMAVGGLAAHDGEEGVLDALGHRAALALPDRDAVHRGDGRHLDRGAGVEQ